MQLFFFVCPSSPSVALGENGLPRVPCPFRYSGKAIFLECSFSPSATLPIFNTRGSKCHSGKIASPVLGALRIFLPDGWRGETVRECDLNAREAANETRPDLHITFLVRPCVGFLETSHMALCSLAASLTVRARAALEHIISAQTRTARLCVVYVVPKRISES
jgi:hypothetical protein